jgi:hypothetical protein
LRRFHSTRREDEIGRKASELGGKGSQTLAISPGKSVFEDDVCALDPAEFAELLTERGMIDGRPIQRRKMPDPVDLPRLLCLGGERRERHAEDDREADQSHAGGESSRRPI